MVVVPAKWWLLRATVAGGNDEKPKLLVKNMKGDGYHFRQKMLASVMKAQHKNMTMLQKNREHAFHSFYHWGIVTATDRVAIPVKGITKTSLM